MRINETYEHEPILPYQAEESCPVGSLTPTAAVGTVTVTCQGSPSITCVTENDGASCTVTMTQQICVSVPVRYGVTLTPCPPSIACADNSCVGCGCC